MSTIKATQILGAQKVEYFDPIKDVHTARLPIAGCAWVDTSEGVVLIDTLTGIQATRKVFEKINSKIKYIIYTHGHIDHVGGSKYFVKDDPEIIASKYLPERLDKYKMLAPHRAHISSVQFNTPELVIEQDVVYPTKTFLGDMTFSLGDKTFELHSVRAETDDALWVNVPELKAVFIGDLIIAGLPNVGNPWKPTRFALSWVKALEAVRDVNPEYIFSNGAAFFYKGDKARKILDYNIEAIQSLHDQVIDYINQGFHITEMIHKVKLPDHLKDNLYLRPLYSRIEFFVFNVYRWYHGYFDNNPAHLLPKPEKEVLKEIYNIIGAPRKILNRVKELFDKNQAQLGLQVLDVLIQADSENVEARKMRIKLLEKIGKEDYCLMSRNTWVYFINKDKKFLETKK